MVGESGEEVQVPDIMDISEAARYLRIKKYTLYKLAKRGKVPGTKIGALWRFKREVLDEMFGNPGPADSAASNGPVPDIMRISEAADYLHVKKWTLYRLVKCGKVPGTKIGGQWRFKREVLDEMFQRGE